MDRQAFEKVREFLNINGQIGIAVGKNPTIDEMAAALALYLGLTTIGKQVSIACPTDPIIELSSLIAINKVRRSFGGNAKALTVSFPYFGKNIEKGSYTVEDGYLNIIVRAGEEGFQFDEKDVKYTKDGGAPSLLFVIGTPRLSDLGPLFDLEALKETQVVNIDNKRENQGFGEAVLVSSELSSVSEQIAELLTVLAIPLDIDIAQNLLYGISYATKNFQDPKTSYKAFETAALLMKKGAHREDRQRPQGIGIADASFLPQPDVRSDFYDRDIQLRDKINKPFPRQNRPFTQPYQQSQSPQSMNKPITQPPPSPENPKSSQPPPKPTEQAQEEEETPSDWLMPKVYKGSTNV